MKKYSHLIILVSILLSILPLEKIMAGPGGYVTLVNATSWNLIITANGRHEMIHWQVPGVIYAGSSVTFYLEYKSIKDKSNAFARYRFDDPNLTGNIFRIDFVADQGPTVTLRNYININGIQADKDHRMGFIHNGIVQFIIVGNYTDGFYSNLSSTSSDWMQNSLNTIGGKSLDRICITGSHDAGMYIFNHSTGGAHECNTLTQDHGILKQLDYGTRYFDIRPVIGGANHFYAGHYGHTPLGWIGTDGALISTIIKDINAFTKIHKELIIVNLSHDFNTNDGYRGLNNTEWENLLSKLSGINHLYKPSKIGDLKKLTLNSLIKNESKVIILVNPKHLPTSSQYYCKGFFNSNLFNTYNSYYGKNDLNGMVNDQIKKMTSNSSSRYFLLSWTLTQSKTEATDCYVTSASSIKDLAKTANQSLPDLLYNKTSYIHYPNIVYTDLITDNNAAIMAMAINYRNVFDKPPPLPKNRISPDKNAIYGFTVRQELDGDESNNNMIFYNYEYKDLLIVANGNEIDIYNNFEPTKEPVIINTISSGFHQSSIDLIFTTQYEDYLVVGWIKQNSYGSWTFYISTTPSLSSNSVWTTKSYSLFNNDYDDIRGACMLTENSINKLCFVKNDRLLKFTFNKTTATISNREETVFNDQRFQNLTITQVLPYKHNAKTNLLFVVEVLSGSYELYQYFPTENKLQYINFWYNIGNIAIIESSISKIYSKKENQKMDYISKRFQVFVTDSRLIPYSNNVFSYIQTFGIHPNDSILSPLTLYYINPPISSLAVNINDLHTSIFASHKYIINNNDTICQSWLWYPATAYRNLAAYIFTDKGVQSSAKLGQIKKLNDINWKIYPNPASVDESVLIEYEIKLNSDIKISLYNIQGTLIKSESVYNQNIGKYNHTLKLKKLSKGTYYVTIIVNNYIESKLLIMQ